MKILIRDYQYFISPIIPAKCRYYPSCSEYAIIEFEKEKISKMSIKNSERARYIEDILKKELDAKEVLFGAGKFMLLAGLCKDYKNKIDTIQKELDRYFLNNFLIL